MSMRYMECWKNIILLIVNNQKNPDRAVLWRRKQQKTGRIDRRDIRKLALHSISFCQRITPRARYRKQVIGDPRKAKPSSAAANMLLWILFLFKLRYSTRNMDIRRFSPLRNIRIPKKDITTQKNLFWPVFILGVEPAMYAVYCAVSLATLSICVMLGVAALSTTLAVRFFRWE